MTNINLDDAAIIALVAIMGTAFIFTVVMLYAILKCGKFFNSKEDAINDSRKREQLKQDKE